MNWFLVALIAPALWAGINHIDKYLLEKYFKWWWEGAIFIFSSIVGLIFIPIIAIFHPETLQYPLSKALLIILNGMMYIIWLVPYVYALKKWDASVIIPLFQLISVFSLIFAWIFLGETLTIPQIVGGFIIIFGSIMLSFEKNDNKKVSFNVSAFWLMVLASFLTSLSFLFFKYFALEASLLTTAFWEYIGFCIMAIIFFAFIPVYRHQFLKVLKENKVSVLSINWINELLNLIGKFSFNFASLLVPITLVWFVVWFQPLFVLIYGIILTLFFPSISKEKISKWHLYHRFIAIFIMLFGSYILYFL